jgi:CelD/BcsL family acetyltransferase involved in cellulose biosynthesis
VGPSSVAVDIVDPNSGSPEIDEAWRRLLAQSTNPYAIYQSPDWFDNKRATKSHERLACAVVRDGAGRIGGVVPVLNSDLVLRSSLKSLTLLKSSFRVIDILGHQPLVQDDPALLNALFAELLRSFPHRNCIRFSYLPKESFCWRHVAASAEVRRAFVIHITEQRTMPYVVLEGGFKDYLVKFKSRTRNTFKRKIKYVEKRVGGSVRLQRFESKEEAGEFLRIADLVAQKSWQHAALVYSIKNDCTWRSHLEDLAERGLFRSYVLSCGDQPYAYLLGHQYGADYHFAITGFDPAIGSFSPGNILFYLIIEDLCGYRKPTRLHWGEGDQEYKWVFSNASMDLGAVLLLRRSLGNRLRHIGHRALDSGIEFVRTRWKKTREIYQRKFQAVRAKFQRQAASVPAPADGDGGDIEAPS